MSLPDIFYSLFVLKDVIDRHYPSGLNVFHNDHPRYWEDGHLIRLCAMSRDDLQEYLDELHAGGLPLVQCSAVAEMVLRSLEPCSAITFTSEELAHFPYTHWTTRRSDAHWLA